MVQDEGKTWIGSRVNGMISGKGSGMFGWVTGLGSNVSGGFSRRFMRVREMLRDWDNRFSERCSRWFSKVMAGVKRRK